MPQFSTPIPRFSMFSIQNETCINSWLSGWSSTTNLTNPRIRNSCSLCRNSAIAFGTVSSPLLIQFMSIRPCCLLTVHIVRPAHRISGIYRLLSSLATLTQPSTRCTLISVEPLSDRRSRDKFSDFLRQWNRPPDIRHRGKPLLDSPR